MEIHHGLLATENKKRKDSKTELFFVAKPFQSYINALESDDIALSPLMKDDQNFIPVVKESAILGQLSLPT
eukprot:15341416-Ditylum_brightwellii.AAC.1